MVYFKINGDDFPQTSGSGNIACLFSSKPLATKLLLNEIEKKSFLHLQESNGNPQGPEIKEK